MKKTLIQTYHEYIDENKEKYIHIALITAKELNFIFNTQDFHLVYSTKNEYLAISSFIALYLQNLLSYGNGNPMSYVLTKKMLSKSNFEIVKISENVFDISNLFKIKE